MTSETITIGENPIIFDLGIVKVGDKDYMPDAKGALVPVESIKAQDKLEDETVRKIMYYARELSAQIARFKQHTFDDLNSFEGLLNQEYGVVKGGTKGNKTFMSFDGLLKVQVSVSDTIDFGPQLQVAKMLLDECLVEWANGSPSELRAIITNAFHTDKAGKINRAEVIKLLKVESADERWNRAMDAIRAAMRVVGSKLYIRAYERPSFDAAWEAVTIDLAKA